MCRCADVRMCEFFKAICIAESLHSVIRPFISRKYAKEGLFFAALRLYAKNVPKAGLNFYTTGRDFSAVLVQKYLPITHRSGAGHRLRQQKWRLLFHPHQIHWRVL